MKTRQRFALKVTEIDRVCEAGEKYGRRCSQEGKVPVFSCEGGCIKGEIARQTANLVAKADGYARACHGELFSVPQADLSKWVREADRVVVIDGCGLFCHGRIAENIIAGDKLININVLAIHGKYADLMDIDDVVDAERKQTAEETADKILAVLEQGAPSTVARLLSRGFESNPLPANACCG